MISTDYSESEEMAKDMIKTTADIVMQVQETSDEFIFSTLNKYAMDHFQMSVKKEELSRAIQLIRMYKEYGFGIDERWATATQQTAALSDAYRRGFQDGITKEHDRIMDILENKKESK